MHLIHTEIDIAAPVDCVWDLLTDFPLYARWNPSIVCLRGARQPGEKLELTARMPGGFVVTLHPTLLKLQPNFELSWSGHLWAPWFMAGEHRFIAERVSPGQVRFMQRETFSGLLSPLFALLFGGGLERSYQRANANLKILAERSATLLRAADAYRS